MRKIKCFHFDLGAGWTFVARLSPSGDLPNQVRANGEKSRLQLTRRSHVHWLTGPAKCWVHPNHRFEQSSEKKMQQTDRLVFSMGLKSAAQCSVQPSSHHVIAITLAKPWLGVKKIVCEGQRQRDRLDQYWHIPFSDEQLTSSHIPFRQPFWQSVQTWNSGAAKLWPSIILHHVMLLVITYGASHSIPGQWSKQEKVLHRFTQLWSRKWDHGPGSFSRESQSDFAPRPRAFQVYYIMCIMLFARMYILCTIHMEYTIYIHICMNILYTYYVQNNGVY
jgi:hypothetical protein